MRIALGTDQDDPLVEAIRMHLTVEGHVVERVASSAEWPEVGRAIARRVAEHTVDVGIVCCWTGTGVTIAANKVAGVRAALCGDAPTASGARRWNDANVLGLSIRLTSIPVGIEIVDAFLSGVVEPSEAAAIDRLEIDS